MQLSFIVSARMMYTFYLHSLYLGLVASFGIRLDFMLTTVRILKVGGQEGQEASSLMKYNMPTDFSLKRAIYIVLNRLNAERGYPISP